MPFLVAGPSSFQKHFCPHQMRLLHQRVGSQALRQRQRRRPIWQIHGTCVLTLMVKEPGHQDSLRAGRSNPCSNPPVLSQAAGLLDQHRLAAILMAVFF
jgi:hypothetical protein